MGKNSFPGYAAADLNLSAWTRNTVTSSNDTKLIQTNNLAVTPQPMTAALIFRRQLVRLSIFYFQQALSASKLPLEKFHRLLDLVFWVKFLKFDIILCFVFLWDVYRVSPGITQPGCRRAGKSRPGGEQQPRTPPGPRSYFDNVYTVYTVYNCL